MIEKGQHKPKILTGVTTLALRKFPPTKRERRKEREGDEGKEGEPNKSAPLHRFLWKKGEK